MGRILPVRLRLCLAPACHRSRSLVLRQPRRADLQRNQGDHPQQDLSPAQDRHPTRQGDRPLPAGHLQARPGARGQRHAARGRTCLTTEKTYRVEKYYEPNFPVLLKEDVAQLEPACRKVAERIAADLLGAEGRAPGSLRRAAL